MSKLLIAANWKMNKTNSEAKRWLTEFKAFANLEEINKKIDVVICPGFHSLSVLQLLLFSSTLRFGAQDVSKFESGAYTGEVSAKQLAGLAKYVILGHSERRKYFGETNDDVIEKINQCQKNFLTPIVCISDLEQVRATASYQTEVNNHQMVIAYEPLFAIGSGQADTPENADETALGVKEILGENTKVIYGGSVDEENAVEFVKERNIEGLLVGTASLDVQQFIKIITRINFEL